MARADSVYDYVVVGGGSAGCVAAGRLASDPTVKVLILEAGDRAEDHPETLRADGYKEAFINNSLIWERLSEPQSGCDHKRLFIGSGRGMGGSGSVNAMVYTRGSEQDYADWNTRGFRFADLVPTFEALEAKLGVAPMAPTEFSEACITAAEASGFRRKENLNDGDLKGCLGYETMNHRDGKRRSAYVAFVKDAAANLTVITRATVQRLVFDDERRVTAVEFERNGKIESVRVGREVILSAGALETPKLLMLSGVGPQQELRRHGISVVLDQPEVGRNLQDHPNVQLFWRGDRPTDFAWPKLYGFHRANHSSDLPPNASDTCYVFYTAQSSFKEGVIRLLPAMILPTLLYRMAWLRAALRGLIKAVFKLKFLQRLMQHMWGIVVILGKPKSRGRLGLRSANAKDAALIDPGYLQDPEDLETLRQGVELARRVAAQPSLAAWNSNELIPGRRKQSQSAVEKFIRNSVITTYHYAGTCRMGEDAASVVDPELRVRGLSGVRIADASVIPRVPVSALNAPSMMLGWKVAELITATRRWSTQIPQPSAVMQESPLVPI